MSRQDLYELLFLTRPIRRALRKLRHADMETPCDIAPLLKALRFTTSWRQRDRIAAVKRLGELDLTLAQRQEAARVLLPLANPSRSWLFSSRLSRWMLRSLAAGLLYQFASFLYAYWLYRFRLDLYFNYGLEAHYPVVPTLIAAPILLPISEEIEDRRMNAVRAAAVTTLGRLRLPETVGTVAAALAADSFRHRSGGSAKVRRAAEIALPELLSRLTPQHLGQIDGKSILSLCRALDHADPAHQLALLHALEKVGDGRAAPEVERFARRIADPMLQQEAERILEVLQERQRQAEASSSLLRAAHTEDLAPHTLLQSAAEPTADPTLLLRNVGSI